jgi:glycosyltransferase involved in cell wall biosynthesis
LNTENFISILITNYNKENFLEKSLHAACNQNFQNYEIILFDDCSKDNSIEIIKRFKKIKLINNHSKKKKSGALSQINGIIECFKKSKGNIICLLDADDYFKKNKLKTVDQYFKDNRKLDCLFDIPIHDSKQFYLKKKSKNYSIWETIFPTSCISVRRNFFTNFLRNINKNNFSHLEIDARLSIFSKFYMNEGHILNKKITKYNYDYNGITANIKKYSSKWWIRRSEAFTYLRIIMKKKKTPFVSSFDYCLTNFFSILLK